MTKNETILWHYTHFWQFEEILKRRALFFAFKNFFEDAFESVDNNYKKQQRYILLKDQMVQAKNLLDPTAVLKDENISGTPEEKIAKILDVVNSTNCNTYITDLAARNASSNKQLNFELNQIGINCWTLEENFCKDMASKFASLSDYVAIRSSLKNILKAFGSNIFNNEDTRFYHNKIQYHQDYDKAKINIRQQVDNLYHMSSQYNSEKEYRFTISLREVSEETDYLFNGSRKKLCKSDELIIACRANKIKEGFFVPINLHLLNMEIHCPATMISKIEEILQKHPYISPDVIPET